jgi:hypothetical protein
MLVDIIGVIGTICVILSFLLHRGNNRRLAILNGFGSALMTIYAFFTSTYLFVVLEGFSTIAVIYFFIKNKPME